MRTRTRLVWVPERGELIDGENMALTLALSLQPLLQDYVDISPSEHSAYFAKLSPSSVWSSELTRVQILHASKQPSSPIVIIGHPSHS